MGREQHPTIINISIHAPREGSDHLFNGFGCPLPHFYPRSPRGERLPSGAGRLSTRSISIHAPREGSDPPHTPSYSQKEISIHAPREGSDGAAGYLRTKAIPFLSTLPARGATHEGRI